MKKLLFSAVSALAVAGIAVAADSTDFGVLCVPSCATQTIVAVPWIAAGTGSAEVKVADFVLTAGLSTGDELMYYRGSGSGYYVWRLDADKKWVPGNTISAGGDSNAPGAQDKTLPVGDSIILKRSNPGSCFYIMGKPIDNTAKELTLVLGYTLVAPPSTAATKVNDLTWEGIVGTKDTVIIPAVDGTGKMPSMKWNSTSGKWRMATSAGWKDDVEIPAGTGVWFYNGGGDGTRKVSWN